MGVQSGAGLEFQHLLGGVQRPDAREGGVEPGDDGLGAALQHRGKRIGVGERRADVGASEASRARSRSERSASFCCEMSRR